MIGFWLLACTFYIVFVIGDRKDHPHPTLVFFIQLLHFDNIAISNYALVYKGTQSIKGHFMGIMLPFQLPVLAFFLISGALPGVFIPAASVVTRLLGY